MLARGLRRRANINPALCQRLVSTYLLSMRHLPSKTLGIHPILFQCWPIVFDADTTLKQHWVNVPCVLGWAPVVGDISTSDLIFNPSRAGTVFIRQNLTSIDADSNV